MNMLASGFENFINGIFANWQMLLFVIAAVLLLMAIAFRRFRTAVLILVLVALGIGAALLTDLVLKAIKWDIPDLVAFAVKWVPTVLFTATVLLSTLVGLKRGLRKSLILLAHEVGAAAVCITAYAVLVRLPAVDGFVLKLVDFFMGGEGSLAKALNVEAECDGIKEVFVEWLPTVINGDFAVMLGGSKAYIYTLADLCYRVAFALVLYIVFLLLVFIMYIIYLCCYSERKHKAKIQKMYVENKVDRRYLKHHAGGGVVGLVRGVAIGLISLSFLGTALYIVAGRGEGKSKDFDFGDKNINEYYSVYRSIESYGTYGIFKVLNSVSSPEDVPYYLFAADLVFSGELDDKEFGVSGNVVFREELSAYTDFARDTMELMLKYGGDEVRSIVNGKTEGAFDAVVNVMSDEGFRAEFNDLISEFDQKTYIINFALSFVNTAIANIDDMSFAPSVSAENKEILKLLFTKGYLSDKIPDEMLLKQMVEGTDLQIIQPYINISKLVNKRDIQIIFNLVLDVLGEKTATTKDVLNLVADILPRIEEISVLDENRAEEMDPVLGRLYAYAANCYLSEEGSAGVTYAEIYEENISWVSEINAFINVAEGSVNLYNNISSAAKPLDAVIAVFDKNDPDYADNISYFDSITDCVLHSRILGKTLTTSRIYKLIEQALGNLFEGIYIPQDLVYETKYNDKGELVQAGEMYNIFNGLGAIGKNSELLPMLKDFDKDKDMEAFLKELSKTVNTKDENSHTLSEYITSSGLLRSVISAAVINSGGDYVYVPTAAREKNADGEPVKYIKAEELTALFDSLSDLVDFILPVLQDKDADMKTAIAEFVEKEVFGTLLNKSTIFEGTVGLHLVKALDGDETVVIPQSLKDNFDGWASDNGAQGEIKNLLDALDAAGVKIAEIVSGEFDVNTVLKNFASDEFTGENLKTCLKSGVLHYTLSKFLTGDGNTYGSFKLIVPEAARQTLENDSIPALVRKSEVENVLKVVKTFGLTAETEISVSDVLSKLVQEENKRLVSESFILSASVVGSLVDNADVNAMLTIPVKFREAATEERLNKFNASNPWKGEVVRLIDALDEILGISQADGRFEFNESSTEGSIKKFIDGMNEPSQINANVSKLTVCYASEVMRCSISAELDEMLAGKIDEGTLYAAKRDDCYTEKELRSLSNALKIFKIDINNLGDEELTQKIKDEILTLNDAAPEGFEGTKLSAVYPSVIFSGMMSKELDNVLLNSTDEDGEVVALIDDGILYDIKGGSARYKEKEIADLINSVNGIGIKDFDELNNLDLNEALDKIPEDKMDEVCASVIMRGVFTKQIGDNNTLGVDHPLAYEEQIKVIKPDEIKAIKNLVGKLNNVEETYFDTIPLSRLNENLFDNNGGIKSYLILRAVSDSIINNENLIVNTALVDRYGCIEAGELRALTSAFKTTFGEDASVSSVNEKEIAYPAADERAVMLASEIVRTKLVDQVVSKNNVAGNLVGVDNVVEFIKYGTEDKCYSLSEDEVKALFNALDIVNTGGGTFKIPTRLTVSDLKTYYDRGQQAGEDYLAVLFGSDVIRYKICDTVLATPAGAMLETEEETAFDIVTHTEQVKRVLSYGQVYAFVEAYAG